MATISQTYSFSNQYLENFKVKVIINTLPEENAVVNITTSLGTTQSITDSDGFSIEIFVPGTETVNIEVNPANRSAQNFNYNFVSGSNFVVFEANFVDDPAIGNEPGNELNFIRWSKASNFHIVGSQLGSKDQAETFNPISGSLQSFQDCKDVAIPNNYRLGKKSVYQLPFFPLDDISFLLNFTPDFGSALDANLRIGILSNSGLLDSNIFNLSVSECNSIKYYYGELIFPTYKSSYFNRFVIYDISNGVVYYLSNPFRVVLEDDKRCYPVLTYSNSCDILNHGYECTGKVNKHRIDFNLIEQQPEIELKQYTEQSTGRVRNQKTQARKVVSVETFFFDDGAHDGMLGLSVHDNINIGGRDYEVKTAYKIENNKQNALQRGVIELYDQKISTLNLRL